jgi:hypothetical protein
VQGARGRWSNGPQAAPRRWSPSQSNEPHEQYAQAERWAQSVRQPRRARSSQPQPGLHRRRPEFPSEERETRKGPEPPPAAGPGVAVDPFELFCAYHLGITPDGTYRIQNIHEVARRFGMNAGALKQTLAAYGMEADDIVHSGFDLASAQVDIMVAPPGISRRELARPLFDEFMRAPRRARNWAREMQEAEREIDRTIGIEGPWSPGPRDRAGKQQS